MRKLCAVILSAVVWLVAAGTPASAAEHQSTLSAGYLQKRDSPNIPVSQLTATATSLCKDGL
ncbi:hypothetical protein CF58_13340 [Escherichia coli]|nr:hypothetical protein CF58_13340 [Escherichia coli]